MKTRQKSEMNYILIRAQVTLKTLKCKIMHITEIDSTMRLAHKLVQTISKENTQMNI